MNLEDQLIVLFQRTLETTKDDHLQTILASQAKIIQQKKENMTPQIETAVQKKMLAFEKIFNDPSKKRRRSRYDDSQNELLRENGRIATQINNLEYRQRESYLRNCHELEQLKKESSDLRELQKKLDDKVRILNNRQNQLIMKESKLARQEEQIMNHRSSINECLQEQKRDDQLLNQRRENMEQLQVQLNTSVSELLGCPRVYVQIDAIEYLVKQTLKERNALSNEQQYLREFKRKVIEEKKQLMKL